MRAPLPRGDRRHRAVRVLSDAFRSHWRPLTGYRGHAYRALANLGLSARLIADGAGVSRRTVRAALAVPYLIPDRVLDVAREVMWKLED